MTKKNFEECKIRLVMKLKRVGRRDALRLVHQAAAETEEKDAPTSRRRSAPGNIRACRPKLVDDDPFDFDFEEEMA